MAWNLRRIINTLTFGMVKSTVEEEDADTQTDSGSSEWDTTGGNAGASDNRDERKRSTRREDNAPRRAPLRSVAFEAQELRTAAEEKLSVKERKQEQQQDQSIKQDQPLKKEPERNQLPSTPPKEQQPAPEKPRIQTQEPLKEPVKAQTQEPQKPPEPSQTQSQQPKESERPLAQEQKPPEQNKPPQAQEKPKEPAQQSQQKPKLPKIKPPKGMQQSLMNKLPKPGKPPKIKAPKAKPLPSTPSSPAPAQQLYFAPVVSESLQEEKKREPEKAKEHGIAIEAPRMGRMHAPSTGASILSEVNVLKAITEPTLPGDQDKNATVADKNKDKDKDKEEKRNKDNKKAKSNGKPKMGAFRGERRTRGRAVAEAQVAAQDPPTQAALEANAKEQRPAQYAVATADMNNQVAAPAIGTSQTPERGGGRGT